MTALTPEERDWQGLQIAKDEPRDAIVDVWEVTPHPDNDDFDCCLVRSWHELLPIITRSAERLIDAADEFVLREGVEIKVRLVKMRRDEFEEIS